MEGRYRDAVKDARSDASVTTSAVTTPARPLPVNHLATAAPAVMGTGSKDEDDNYADASNENDANAEDDYHRLTSSADPPQPCSRAPHSMQTRVVPAPALAQHPKERAREEQTSPPLLLTATAETETSMEDWEAEDGGEGPQGRLAAGQLLSASDMQILREAAEAQQVAVRAAKVATAEANIEAELKAEVAARRERQEQEVRKTKIEQMVEVAMAKPEFVRYIRRLDAMQHGVAGKRGLQTRVGIDAAELKQFQAHFAAAAAVEEEAQHMAASIHMAARRGAELEWAMQNPMLRRRNGELDWALVGLYTRSTMPTTQTVKTFMRPRRLRTAAPCHSPRFETLARGRRMPGASPRFNLRAPKPLPKPLPMPLLPAVSGIPRMELVPVVPVFRYL